MFPYLSGECEKHLRPSAYGAASSSSTMMLSTPGAFMHLAILIASFISLLSIFNISSSFVVTSSWQSVSLCKKNKLKVEANFMPKLFYLIFYQFSVVIHILDFCIKIKVWVSLVYVIKSCYILVAMLLFPGNNNSKHPGAWGDSGADRQNRNPQLVFCQWYSTTCWKPKWAASHC